MMSARDAKDKVKVKIEEGLERGYSYNPNTSAMVLIVGDKRIALSRESAQYALCNMIFYAQVKGIGSCLWGNGQIFLDRSKVAREILGLQKYEHILGTLLLGYPEVKFANKVGGKTIPTEWVERS